MKKTLLSLCFTFTLITSNLYAQEPKKDEKKIKVDVVTRVNNAFASVLEAAVKGNDLIITAKDKTGKPQTFIELDKKETIIEKNQVKVSTKVTLKTSAWTSKKVTNATASISGKLDAKEELFYIGGSLTVASEAGAKGTLPFVKFVAAQLLADAKTRLTDDVARDASFKKLVALLESVKDYTEIKQIGTFFTDFKALAIATAAREDVRTNGVINERLLKQFKAAEINYDKNTNTVTVKYVKPKELDFIELFKQKFYLSKVYSTFSEDTTFGEAELALKVTQADITDFEKDKVKYLEQLSDALDGVESSPESKDELAKMAKKYIDTMVKFLTDSK